MLYNQQNQTVLWEIGLHTRQQIPEGSSRTEWGWLDRASARYSTFISFHNDPPSTLQKSQYDNTELVVIFQRSSPPPARPPTFCNQPTEPHSACHNHSRTVRPGGGARPTKNRTTCILHRIVQLQTGSAVVDNTPFALGWENMPG